MLAFLTLAVLPSGRLAAWQCPDGSPPPCAGRAVRPSASPTSVAVLYFDNLSRDSSDAFLADGLTEELIARLGQVERLQVKSRTAVLRLRGRPLDEPADIGRALNVVHFVSGSVRRSGTRLRVTAELTRASSGVQVWSQTYDRASDDLMGVESEIAQAIATGVGGRLAPAEQRTLAARPTTSPEAYEHFVRGNLLLARRTAPDMRRAIAEFETAAQLDPSFARARARAGLGYALFLDWAWVYPGLSDDSVLERLSRSARQALAIDSLSGDAWMVQAMSLVFRFPRTYQGVIAAFERGVAAESRNAEMLHQFAGYTASLGDGERAERLWRQALALEPERPITLDNLANFLTMARRYDEARHLLDSALRYDPLAHYVRADLAWLRLVMSDTAAARAQADSAGATTLYERSLIAPLRATLAAQSGDTVTARRILETLDRDLPPDFHIVWPITHIAAGWAAAGDTGRALELLERIEPRGIGMWYELKKPGLDPLRQLPRFQRLVEETRPTGGR
jgi:TolB-like protein/Tfp pilus assembly protein PilF